MCGGNSTVGSNPTATAIDPRRCPRALLLVQECRGAGDLMRGRPRTGSASRPTLDSVEGRAPRSATLSVRIVAIDTGRPPDDGAELLSRTRTATDDVRCRRPRRHGGSSARQRDGGVPLAVEQQDRCVDPSDQMASRLIPNRPRRTREDGRPTTPVHPYGDAGCGEREQRMKVSHRSTLLAFGGAGPVVLLVVVTARGWAGSGRASTPRVWLRQARLPPHPRARHHPDPAQQARRLAGRCAAELQASREDPGPPCVPTSGSPAELRKCGIDVP